MTTPTIKMMTQVTTPSYCVRTRIELDTISKLSAMKTRSRKAGAFVVETGDGAPFEEEDTRLPRPRCCLRCGRFLLPLLLGLVASLGLIVQVLVRLYVPVIGGKLRASPARAKVPRRSCLPPEKILGSLVSSHGAREGEGFSMPGAIIWGGSVVRGQDDGLYHMYASRWDERLGHNAWVSSSEVVHATSERPGGPYTFRDVALPRRGSQHWDGLATHNPTVHWHPQRREYLLFYTGITYGFEPPDAARPFTNRTQYELAWNTKRVGVASSASPHGPWRRLATPILVPRHGRWDAAITSNPAALVMRDGSLLLLYKSIALGYPERNLRKGAEAATFHIGAAVATSPRGPYSRLQESPILTDAGMPLAAEDPYIWRCGGRKKGLTYHLVFKVITNYQLLITNMTNSWPHVPPRLQGDAEDCGTRGRARHTGRPPCLHAHAPVAR